jgi:hypothetical protein
MLYIVQLHTQIFNNLYTFVIFPGEGLGKNSQGIPEPIKPSLKFDKTGVGHDLAEEFTSTWWNDAYTKAVDNVTIDNEQVLDQLKFLFLWITVKF